MEEKLGIKIKPKHGNLETIHSTNRGMPILQRGRLLSAFCFLLSESVQRTAIRSWSQTERSDPGFQPDPGGGLGVGNANISNVSEHFIVQTFHSPPTPREVLTGGAEPPGDTWASDSRPGGPLGPGGWGQEATLLTWAREPSSQRPRGPCLGLISPITQGSSGVS